MKERTLEADKVGGDIAFREIVRHVNLRLQERTFVHPHLTAKFHSIANEFRMAVVWALLTPWPGDQTWTEKSLS